MTTVEGMIWQKGSITKYFVTTRDGIEFEIRIHGYKCFSSPSSFAASIKADEIILALKAKGRWA